MQSGWSDMEKYVSEKREHLANLSLAVNILSRWIFGAGISKRSATPVLIFTGIMKKEFYVGEILEKVLLPFTQSTFPDGDYRFQQDNDPKHKSKFITLFSY